MLPMHSMDDVATVDMKTRIVRHENSYWSLGQCIVVPRNKLATDYNFFYVSHTFDLNEDGASSTL